MSDGCILLINITCEFALTFEVNLVLILCECKYNAITALKLNDCEYF